MEHKILIKKIFNEVINPGNCFHCGLCQGLSKNLFKMSNSDKGPTPILLRKSNKKDIPDLKKIVHSCPGRGFSFNFLSKKIKTKKKSKILGNYNSIYIGSSNSDLLRNKASSGGIIRSVLMELIKRKEVDYACILDEKKNKILDFDILVTNKLKKILNASQSIYQTTPLLHKLNKLNKKKRYVFVGLPEHIASIRSLKIKYPKDFEHIKYLISLYSGTNMYPGAISFYLRGNGIKNNKDIKKINWRYGEWPGKLRIILKNKKILSLKKFYYNYLIPFFISKSCLITPDFTGELSDISIGDAWSPKLEGIGHGFSVIISRSKKIDLILRALGKKKINLEPIDQKKAISMHAHMIEFKKIGSYLRIEKLKKKGPVPLYDLKPKNISLLRRLIEFFIGLIILTASKNSVKSFFSFINSNLLGFFFQILRQIWKKITKTTKRKGLNKIKFTKIKNERLREFSN